MSLVTAILVMSLDVPLCHKRLTETLGRRALYTHSTLGYLTIGLRAPIVDGGLQFLELGAAELERIISIFVRCASLLWSNQPRHLDVPQWVYGRQACIAVDKS